MLKPSWGSSAETKSAVDLMQCPNWKARVPRNTSEPLLEIRIQKCSCVRELSKRSESNVLVRALIDMWKIMNIAIEIWRSRVQTTPVVVSKPSGSYTWMKNTGASSLWWEGSLFYPWRGFGTKQIKKQVILFSWFQRQIHHSIDVVFSLEALGQLKSFHSFDTSLIAPPAWIDAN